MLIRFCLVARLVLFSILFTSFILASIINVSNDVDSSQIGLDASQEINADKAQTYYNLGMQLKNEGDLNKAIEAFQEAIKYSPEFTEAHREYIQLMMDVGMAEEVKKEYRIMVQRNPDSEVFHYLYGRTLVDWDQQMYEYMTAVEINPEYFWGHFGLGWVYNVKEMSEECLSEYLIAIEIDPDNSGAHYNLGLVYSEKGLIDEAIVEYKAAIRLDPDYSNAHNNLGLVYYDKGLIDEAIVEYKAAIKLDPDYSNAHNNLGIVYYEKGLIDEAIAEYKAAIKLDPDYSWAHNNLGVAYRKKGMKDAAIQQYREAIRCDPSNTTANKNLESLLIIKQKPHKFTVGIGLGKHSPLNLYGDNYNGGYSTSLHFGWVSYTEQTGIEILSQSDFDEIFSEVYLEICRLQTEIKEKNANQNLIKVRKAIISGVRWGRRGAPVALTYPKYSNNPSFIMTFPIDVKYAGVSFYKFRFLDDETKTNLGGQTLTELGKNIDKIKYGNNYNFGVNALFRNYLSLDLFIRLETIYRSVMPWHMIISGAIEAIPMIGIDYLIKDLSNKWKWLYLYRVPYFIALYNFQYDNPNWPFHDRKPMNFITYEIAFQWRF